MSKKERGRLKVLEQLVKGDLSHEAAAAMLNVSERHLWRLRWRYNTGDEHLVHRLRGRTSNRRTDPALRLRVLDIYRMGYSDYGPTLFAEELAERHDITLSAETIRQWLIAEGLWEKARKRRRHRMKRPRRAAIGDMVQVDGSYHDWFEGRGACCTLLVIIDDASGRVYLRFAPSENAAAIMRTFIDYARLYGLPRQVYSDHGGVFYNSGDPEKKTDFTIALQDVGVEIIHANSPQAKGRVERSNRTHQDRLIKAMRREGISTIEDANRYLERHYIADHNRRFAKLQGLSDVHRSAEGIDLAHIFCFRTMRTVNNDFTVRLNSQYLQLVLSGAAMPPPRARVEIRRRLDQRLPIYWKAQELTFKAFKHTPATNTLKLPKPPKVDHPWHRKNILGDKRKRPTARQITRERQQPF